jgi:hypothetical protein
MTVTDRAIFLLGHFQIPMSENEYIGLRLTDGLYEEANKTYYISWNPDWSLKSNIAYILHQADSMATHIENDEWKHGVEESEKKHQKKYKNLLGDLKTDDSDSKEKPTEVKEDNLNKKSKDLFNELFGDA